MASNKKHVRFADWIAPATPSPSYSTSTLSSSAGPSTPLQIPVSPPQIFSFIPPQYIPSPSHYTTSYAMAPMVSPPMPPPRSVQVWLDPILARPEGSAFPPLIWDLMVHPNNIRLGSAIGLSRAQVLSKSDLERYAAAYVDNGAHVPLRTITLRLHQLPRDIEIVPTTLPYVTVRDVLYELYRTLRISVERGEYRDLPRREREALQDAFRARLARVVDPFARAEDERFGIRRIDFLGDRRMFLGLLPAVGHDIPYGKRAGEAFMVDVVRAL